MFDAYKKTIDAVLSLSPLFFIYAFASFLLVLVSAYTYPAGLIYMEGVILHGSEALASGQNIYPSLDEAYPMVTNYPPAYYAAYAALIKLFGPSVSLGRALSGAAGLFSAALVFLLTLKSTGDRRIAFLSSAIFLASQFVMQWSTFAAPDMLALAFTLAGAYLFVRGKTKHSLVFFALGFLTKQSHLSAPLAAVIYLAGTKKGSAAGYAASFAVLVFAALLAIECASGWWFHEHVLNHAYHELSLVKLINYETYAISIPLQFLVLFAAAAYAFSEAKSGKTSFMTNYFLISLASTLTVAKVGGGTNYFLEVIASAAVLTGLLIRKALLGYDKVWEGRRMMCAGFVCLVGAAVLFSFHHPYQVSPEQLGELRGIEKLINDSSGRIISYDTMSLAESGKKQYILELFSLTRMSGAGRWDQTTLLEDLRSGNISLIICSKNASEQDKVDYLQSPEMRQAIEENYEINLSVREEGAVDRIYTYFIYQPKT